MCKVSRVLVHCLRVSGDGEEKQMNKLVRDKLVKGRHWLKNEWHWLWFLVLPLGIAAFSIWVVCFNKYLWLLSGLGILLLSGKIYSGARVKVFEKSLLTEQKMCKREREKERGRGERKEPVERLDSNWGIILLLYYSLIFVGLVVLTYLIFGEDHLFEGFIAGALIVSFIIFELPRLLTPHMYVMCYPAIKGSKTRSDVPCSTITVTAGEKALLFFRITNLGVNNYQNCTFWFSFSDCEGFVPLEDPNLYNGVDFRKEFQLQKRTRTVLFPPDKNYQTVAPGNSIYFPIWVQTPQAVDNANTEVKVEATSETRTGEFRKTLKVNVV